MDDFDSDLAARERSTASQERLQETLIARLAHEGIQTALFCNVRFAMRTRAIKGQGYCVRAADALLLRHGFVIELDGGVHDNLDKRCRRIARATPTGKGLALT